MTESTLVRVCECELAVVVVVAVVVCEYKGKLGRFFACVCN